MKYPVGPKTRKLASETEPGKLASLLNQVLYSTDTADVPLTGSASTMHVKRLVMPFEVYRGNDPLPCSIPASGSKDQYFKTESLILVIRDYLEFMSFKEIIP